MRPLIPGKTGISQISVILSGCPQHSCRINPDLIALHTIKPYRQPGRIFSKRHLLHFNATRIACHEIGYLYDFLCLQSAANTYQQQTNQSDIFHKPELLESQQSQSLPFSTSCINCFNSSKDISSSFTKDDTALR